MTKKKKRLGRGLDALLSASQPSAEPTNKSAQDSTPTSLPIEKLQPGEYQPRTNMDADSLQ
nr:hypothetical protein [Acidiferrobacterales bacterium]